jgi:hypothetical protein
MTISDVANAGFADGMSGLLKTCDDLGVGDIRIVFDGLINQADNFINDFPWRFGTFLVIEEILQAQKLLGFD